MKFIGAKKFSQEELAKLPSRVANDLVITGLIKEANNIGLAGKRVSSLVKYIDYDTNEAVYLFKGEDNEPA